APTAAGPGPIKIFEFGLRLLPEGGIWITAEEVFHCCRISCAVETRPGDRLFLRGRSRLLEVGTVEHHGCIRLEGTRIRDQFLRSGHEPKAMGAGRQFPGAWRLAHRKP